MLHRMWRTPWMSWWVLPFVLEMHSQKTHSARSRTTAHNKLHRIIAIDPHWSLQARSLSFNFLISYTFVLLTAAVLFYGICSAKHQVFIKQAVARGSICSAKRQVFTKQTSQRHACINMYAHGTQWVGKTQWTFMERSFGHSQSMHLKDWVCM